MPGVLPTPLLTTGGGPVTLLAAYNFDEASGAVVDVTGNGHDFTPDAAITRQTGHTNAGLRHESTAANSLGPAIFGQTANRTLMAWVKRTSNGVDGWILEMKNATADTGVWGFLYSGSTIQARAKNSSNVATFASAAQPTVNTWHHLAMTYDGTTIRLYIDGTQAATAAFTGPIWASATFFPFFDAVSTETVIDDVRIYDAALDATAITADMNAPVTSGGASFSGTAALSGSGTLTNTGTPALSRTVALTGSGALAHTGTPATSGSVALAGSGTLAVSGKPAIPATVALTGAGQATAAGTPATTGSLTLAGSGAQTPTGTPAVTGTTALAGTGALTPTGTPGHKGTTALTGAGTLSTAGQPMLPGNLSLSGGGQLLGATGNNHSGAVNLTGAGTLAPTGKAALVGALSLAGAGALATIGAPGHKGVVLFTGSGQLAKAGSFVPAVQPVLTVNNAPSSGLTPGRRPVLTPANAPSSHLEVSHVV